MEHSTRPSRLLIQGLGLMGIAATPQQREQWLALVDLLARWSRAYNLTAIREPERMIPHHLLDSLAVAPYLRGDRVLDVGTGAGFPGLPLAILRPDIRFTLLDGNGKKVRFVRQAVMELGLGNVEAVQSRIEAYRSQRKFATIIARAFAALSDILRLTMPLMDRGGVLLALKGRRAGVELEEVGARDLNARLHRLEVPFLDAERWLVEIESPHALPPGSPISARVTEP